MQLFFLIPGNTEVFAGSMQHIGHLDLHTVYLDIQRKRDTFYILLAITIMLSYTIIPKMLLIVSFGAVFVSIMDYACLIHKVYHVL
jgi:hypothetical protein